VGGEWLALPPALFLEIAAPRPIHSLPHRRSKAVRGLVNVRGELQICLSLAELLGLSAAPASPATATPRLLVGGREIGRFVFPVEEIEGLHRFAAADLVAPPATVARALASHTHRLFTLRERAVGWLDEAALLATCERSVG
jgi:chemotaxis-related protein WspD